MEYLNLADSAVAIAHNIGAYRAEAYILDAKSLSIEVANQQVETLKFAEDCGIGLRIISKKGTIGFAYSTDLTLKSLDKLARQALDNSQQSFADELNVLPVKLKDIPRLPLLDPVISSTNLDDKIEMAKKMERFARKADDRITRIERCAYEDVEYGIALSNSNGLSTSYRSAYCGLYASVLAEKDGSVENGMAINYTRKLNKLDPQAVGIEAAEDACRLLGAKSIETTTAVLVLSPYITTNFFSVLMPALSADAVQKGRSLFKGKLGQKVVSPLINIIDDGQLQDGIATSPVDGEGVQTQQTDIIIDGVLQGYLYNTYTAMKDNVASTGNGVRGSFKNMPEVGPTNLYLSSGDVNCQQLFHDIKDGFYVTSVMGMHTANPVSGDFSVGAAGLWIKNGQLSQPVRGVAIAGNILELFSKVDGVANDLRFFGAFGAPTIRISDVRISGT